MDDDLHAANDAPRLTFTGSVDFALIAQRAGSGDAAGDLLAGALGVELGV